MPAFHASSEMLAGAIGYSKTGKLLEMPKAVRRDYIAMLMWLATGFDDRVPVWRTAASLHNLLRRGFVELLIWPDGFMAVRAAPGVQFPEMSATVH